MKVLFAACLFLFIAQFVCAQTKFRPLPCFPAFPHRDGWVGGDGDVSVRISDSVLLWLFSDSWVGKPNQTRQEEGLRMIPNSVAVCSCSGRDSLKMKYYWGDMYGRNPKAVFNSNTDQFKYWVNDAFMVSGYLYVLLEKIGRKENVSPGELFDFTSKGFTFAKVLNPLEQPPDWRIEFLPLPEFSDPSLSLRCHALLGIYVYFFVNKGDTAQLLVRKKVALLDNTAMPFEYFALNGAWKTGIQASDMATVYKGFRGTTVKWHSGIRKWLMLSDVHFMDNKIKFRTAPELTGPWSEEKTIYQIPETTMGSEEYDEENFCYLPRECTAGFVVDSNELLITYDINYKSHSKFRSNPKLYTPKVIRVRMD